MFIALAPVKGCSQYGMLGASQNKGVTAMARMKASDFPQELLDLFHEYQHGYISRRAFLDGAQKFTVGSMTAVGLFEALRPNYAYAQQVAKDDKRIRTEY